MNFSFDNQLRSANVMLVDDDPGDRELTVRALADGPFRVNLQVLEDGEQALDYLFRQGKFSDPDKYPLPDIILLDLNMPKINGKEVLEQIRRNQDFNRIVVIVLTTSDQESDILHSYNLGCHSYITKPVDVSAFIGTLHKFGDYWFQLVRLPLKS